MSAVDAGIELLSINTIRTLAIDAVQKANSGHPGLPLGAAPMAYVLWQRHLRHNPTDPHWPDRDRFVLSAGHGSMLLYALAAPHRLRPDDGRPQVLPPVGQPHAGAPRGAADAGVEATTGPLGQGTANAVGMAIAERMLAHRFNRPGHTIVDHRTYALVSDGDLMEGDLRRSRVARRPSEARQADLPLRLQPRLARRADVAGVLDGGRRRALRGVRLAGAARRRTATPTSRRSTPRIKAAEAETGAPVADRHRDDDRLRLAAQAGHLGGARQPARG